MSRDSPSSGSLGSGKSRWADLEVEDEQTLAQLSDLGVGASSDGSDHARSSAARGSKKVRQDVSSCSDSEDSSGYPSLTVSGGKRFAPPLPNKSQSISGYQHITFNSDSSHSGSFEKDAKQNTSGSAGSTRLMNRDGYSDAGGRDQLDHLRGRLMQHSAAQHYLRVRNSRSLSAGQDDTAEHQPSQRTDAIASTAFEASVRPVMGQANSAAPPAQLDGSEQLPSVGSALHNVGGCKPCLLIVAKSGCAQGADCDFCHFRHVRKSMRPSKGKRERFKRLLERAGHTEPNSTGLGNKEVTLQQHLGQGLLSL